VEGVHFTRETPAAQVGRKALARCLSDIAAMGGTAAHAVITLALPQDFTPAYVQELYQGLNALAREHGVAIVGGETTTNAERYLVSVALTGWVDRQLCLLRSGARPGQAIFVTGELGGSLAGRHLDFEPRLAEGRWLAAHFKPTAMIDLSDGLASDLRHLLAFGGLGADLLETAIPVSRAAKVRARQSTLAKPPLVAALTDGEDFELLFTVATTRAVPLVDAWKAAFPKVRLSCIGRITPQPGLRVRTRTGVKEFGGHGYVHFS
jgi:thiamine-monophosphate kinase